AASAAIAIARLRRVIARSDLAKVSDLTDISPQVATFRNLETGEGLDAKPEMAYAKLAHGRLEEALAAAKAAYRKPDRAPGRGVRRRLARSRPACARVTAQRGYRSQLHLVRHRARGPQRARPDAVQPGNRKVGGKGRLG